MKKIIFLLIIAFSIHSAFGQQTFTKQDFLQKSKNKNTLGWCLVTSGFIAGFIGVVINIKDEVKTLISVPGNILTGSPVVEEDNYSTELIIGGGIAIISSIPLFIASTKNRKKAMSMSFKNQRIPQLQNSGFVYRPVPSINLKIDL
jgi:hypothetical protein